jgi:hypothetical protein
MEFVYFLVAHLTLSYLGPLLVIFVSYVLVFQHIWQRQIPSESAEMEAESKMLHQSKMRALRMLAAVVIAFFISFLPLYVTFMRFKLVDLEGNGWDFPSEKEEFWIWICPFAQWMSSANSCLNPFLYNFLDPKFRARFRELLRLPSSSPNSHHLQAESVV